MALVVDATAATAQDTSVTRRASDRAFWSVSAVALTGAFALDERMREIALANHTRALDRVAGTGDVLGTARYLVPSLAVTYALTRILHRDALARSTLRVALSYAAADALESVVKPIVGRQRPFVTGEPWTFRPATTNGDFYSFPSAHVAHIASLSAAVAMEADRGWVTALAAGATGLVAAQRVYRDQHWTSDVVASGIIGITMARLTHHWLAMAGKGAPPHP
jgi:membrane-associated phospholipid phosphatase